MVTSHLIVGAHLNELVLGEGPDHIFNRGYSYMSLSTSAHAVWEAALGRLQVQVPRPTYETWLKDTHGELMAANRLIVRVPSTFVAEWLETRMIALITDAVSAVTGTTSEVELRVREDQGVLNQVQPPYANFPNPNPALSKTAFNSRYTFESFVIGPSNHFAFYSSQAVVEQPGTAYNPLYIHGSVGLGKTHLLHAIGAKAVAEGYRVQYISSEQFTTEFTRAIRDRRMDEFQEQYKALQVLLIDDVQFLAGKDGTQSAFFHIFNELHTNNCQIVVAADRPSGSLVPFNDRLKSRFEWGLSVEITEPDYETRVAILEKHAGRISAAVPSDVVDYIANATTHGVRQLEGSLNKVLAMSQFSGEPITKDLATRILKTAYETRAASPEAVIIKVASFYGISLQDIKGGARNKAISQARQAAMLLLRQTGLRPDEIGAYFGQRDRTTVAYAIQKASTRANTDITFQKSLEALQNVEN